MSSEELSILKSAHYRHTREKGSRAVDSYIEIAHRSPNEPEVFFNLGRAYEMNGQLNKATAAFLEATKRFPFSSAAFLRLGIVYAKQKEEAQAVAAFDQAERLYLSSTDEYGSVEVLHQRSILSATLGRADEARRYDEQALRSSNGDLFQRIRVLFHLACVFYPQNQKSGEFYEAQAVNLAQQVGRDGLLPHGADELLTQGLVVDRISKKLLTFRLSWHSLRRAIRK